MKDFSIYVGILAGVSTAVSLIPQLVKIIKDKKAEDISLIMLLVLLAGVGGWIVYGAMKNDLPIIITNSFSFVLNQLIIAFSLKYKKSTSTK